jgi:hypothetical protein
MTCNNDITQQSCTHANKCTSFWDVPYPYNLVKGAQNWNAADYDTVYDLRAIHTAAPGIHFNVDADQKDISNKLKGLLARSWLVDPFGQDWGCTQAPERPRGALGHLQGILRDNLSNVVTQQGFDPDSIIIQLDATSPTPTFVPLGTHSLGTFNARRTWYEDSNIKMTIEMQKDAKNNNEPILNAILTVSNDPHTSFHLQNAMWNSTEIVAYSMHYDVSTDAQFMHLYGLIPKSQSLFKSGTTWTVFARRKSFHKIQTVTLPITYDATNMPTTHAYTDLDFQELTAIASADASGSLSVDLKTALHSLYARPRVSWPSDDDSQSRLVPRYHPPDNILPGLELPNEKSTMQLTVADICKPEKSVATESLCNCGIQTFDQPFGAGQDAYTRYYAMLNTSGKTAQGAAYGPECNAYCGANPRATPFPAGVSYPGPQDGSKCPSVEICEENVNIIDSKVSKINIRAACNQIDKNPKS